MEKRSVQSYKQRTLKVHVRWYVVSIARSEQVFAPGVRL